MWKPMPMSLGKSGWGAGFQFCWKKASGGIWVLVLYFLSPKRCTSTLKFICTYMVRLYFSCDLLTLPHHTKRSWQALGLLPWESPQL